MVRRLAVLVILGCALLPALAAQNETPDALRAMDTGKEHLRRDEFVMALRSFSTYAELAPHNSRPYYLLACTYLRMDSIEPASRSIEQAQRADSTQTSGYFADWLNGIILLRQEHTAGADSALSRAALVSPFVARPRIARARQNADSLFASTGDTEQSSAEYRLKLGDLLLDEFVDYQLFRENGDRTY